MRPKIDFCIFLLAGEFLASGGDGSYLNTHHCAPISFLTEFCCVFLKDGMVFLWKLNPDAPPPAPTGAPDEDETLLNKETWVCMNALMYVVFHFDSFFDFALTKNS